MIKVICSFKKLDGPRVDGGWVIQFDIPEMCYDKIKDLPYLAGKNIILEIKEEIQNDGNAQGLAQGGDKK